MRQPPGTPKAGRTWSSVGCGFDHPRADNLGTLFKDSGALPELIHVL